MGSKRQTSCFSATLWLVAVVLVILGIIGIVLVNQPNQYYCNPKEYGVVFDGGSSHTSMAVYQWLAESITEFGTGIASQLAFEDSCGDAGISSYADDPEGLVPGFEKCLATASLVIPEYSHAKTPIFLGATAGMRLLNMTDPDKSDAVLAVVRETLANSPFDILYKNEQAIILRGEKEGSSSWISVNYLEANLGVLKNLPDKMKYKVTYCFQSMYIKALLFDAFKFDASNWDIDFTLQINDVDLGWLLGFTVNATSWVPLEQACVGINSSSSIGLLVIFIIVLVVGLLLLFSKLYWECFAAEGETYQRVPSKPEEQV